MTADVLFLRELDKAFVATGVTARDPQGPLFQGNGMSPVKDDLTGAPAVDDLEGVAAVDALEGNTAVDDLEGRGSSDIDPVS